MTYAWKQFPLLASIPMIFLLALVAAQSPAPDSGAPVHIGDAAYTHAGGVTALARSPGGAVLVTAGADQSVRIWDLLEARERVRFQHPESRAEFVAVSPDGLRLATCGPDSRIRLWTLPDAKPLTTLTEKGRIVAGLAFVAGDHHLLSARTDGTLAFWDTSTASIVRSWSAHRHSLSALAVSPDGTRVATAGEKDGIALWEVPTGEPLFRTEAKPSTVQSLGFSPDGKKLAAGSEHGGLAVWDLSTGRPDRERPMGTPRREAVTCVAFRPDGAALALGDAGGELALWDLSKDAVRSLEPSPFAPLTGLAFSQDGSMLVTGDAAGRIVFRDAAGGSVRFASSGHRGRIRALSYSPGGEVLASGGDDRLVRIWDTASGKEIRTLEGSPSALTSLSFSPDGRRLLGTAQDPAARIWDTATGKLLGLVRSPGASLTTGAWSPDGAGVALGAVDGRLLIAEGTGASDPASFGDHTHAVTGLFFSRWTPTIVSASYDSTVRIWDSASRKQVRRFDFPDNMPYAVATSPDGRILAVASVGRIDRHRWVPEHRITCWDTSTGQNIAEVARFETLGSMHGSIEFAPDGRHLFALRDGVLKAWRLPDGPETAVPIKSGEVTAFRFSPDGRSLALATEDLTIAIRDVSALLPTAKPTARLDAAALSRHWDDLGRPEADRAFRSICALADSPESAVEFLRTRIVPVSMEEVERLIAGLDDDDAAVRDQAARRIRVVGTPELLEQFLERKLPLETALRVRALISEQKEMKAGAPDLERILRAISVLEMAGTPEAKSLLEKMTSGADSARQTQAARSALMRLRARKSP